MKDQPNKTQKRPARRKKRRWWVRLLMFVLFLLAAVLAVIGGLIIGYVRLGGGTMAEVWKLDTWKHLYDLVFA